MSDDAVATRDRLLREAIAWDDSLCDCAEDLEIEPEWKREARELLGIPAPRAAGDGA